MDAAPTDGKAGRPFAMALFWSALIGAMGGIVFAIFTVVQWERKRAVPVYKTLQTESGYATELDLPGYRLRESGEVVDDSDCGYVYELDLHPDSQYSVNVVAKARSEESPPADAHIVLLGWISDQSEPLVEIGQTPGSDDCGTMESTRVTLHSMLDLSSHTHYDDPDRDGMIDTRTEVQSDAVAAVWVRVGMSWLLVEEGKTKDQWRVSRGDGTVAPVGWKDDRSVPGLNEAVEEEAP